jgi:glyoxylase-like metal-dependent hydrolase (beta-lactamase superfamily II)
MLKIRKFGPVEIFKMGKNIGPVVPYTVHSFLLDNTLIDTGTIGAGKEFIAALKTKKIERIINTHFHEDHTGNNAEIGKMFNAAIYADAESIPYIADPEKIRLKFYQKIVWEYPEPSAAEPIDDKITSGKYTFDVIPVKGHSAGHICLYEPENGWLFTGDMFCGVKNIYLRQDENFNQLLSSLEKLSGLKINTIFCALKGVVENGKNALDAKISFMRGLKKNTFELYDSGHSPSEIRKKLLGYEDRMYYLTSGHFSKQKLIISILENK